MTQDSQVRPLRQPIPFGLTDATTTSTSTIAPATSAPPTTTTLPATTAAPSFPLTIYLVDASNRLQAVERSAPSRPSPDIRLATLTAGTVANDAAGMRSPANGAVFSGVRIQGGTAIVSVGPGYADLEAGQAALATGQLVYTLTELPGVGKVRLVNGDETITAVRADGSAADGDVSQDDYKLLTSP